MGGGEGLAQGGGGGGQEDVLKINIFLRKKKLNHSHLSSPSIYFSNLTTNKQKTKQYVFFGDTPVGEGEGGKTGKTVNLPPPPSPSLVFLFSSPL